MTELMKMHHQIVRKIPDLQLSCQGPDPMIDGLNDTQSL